MHLWHKIGIVVSLEVDIQELLLPEALVTLLTGVRLLPSVYSPVHLHVPLLFAPVVALITTEPLFSLM